METAPRFIDGLLDLLAGWKSHAIPTFGRPIGVVVNYSPDYAIHYDLRGNEIELLDRAYRLGEISFSLSGRRSPMNRLALSSKSSPAGRQRLMT